jgi:hypothetical protein
MANNPRVRPAESAGEYTKLHGEYRMSAMSGLVTLAAAATSSAGHLFVMRNPSTTKKVVVRYVSAQFATTTAMSTAQPMGYALHVTRGATAVYTGGTAIDMFTVTGSQKMRANQDLTLFTVNNVRIATTAGLTVPVTQDYDAHPISQKMFLSPALGAVAEVELLDARDDGGAQCRSALVLGYQECLVIENVVLMGAAGVGYFIPTIEWDEVTI